MKNKFYLLYVDFKQASDLICLYEILKEFRIPKKLVSLVKNMKIQGQLTETFDIERGLRQGDALYVQVTVHRFIVLTLI